MPHMREIKTCHRCRHFKRRCDLIKPSCSRCTQAGVQCSFDTSPDNAGGLGPPASDPTHSSNSQITSHAGVSIRKEPGRVYINHENKKNCSASPSSSPEAYSSVSATTGSTPKNSSQSNQTSNGSIPEAVPRIVRKRKRNSLSCSRCHRLKVKCDKELPCGRCRSSGNGRECYYSFNKGPNGGRFPCPTDPVSEGEAGKGVMATWRTAHGVRGSSHWRELMSKIASFAGVKASDLSTHLEDVITNACLANFYLPGNFPFGTPGAAKYGARDAVVRLIESERTRVPSYIESYVNLLDVVNPIVDLDEFAKEVDRYWEDPHAVGLCWLSQFLMVIGLGSFGLDEESTSAIELMMASEACLMQTPFMFRPTLLTLRTMAIMVVAKQVCNGTCWSIDSCWSLLGQLVRMCFIYGLPQEQMEGDVEIEDPAERDSRRKLWLTILYLDIKVSMCTGMPPLTRPDEIANLQVVPSYVQPDSLQMVLYRSLPTVLEILGHINSKNNAVTYAEVLVYDTKMRELITYAQQTCPEPLQRSTMDIFLRRSLMVLHRPFALHADGPTMYPDSYWSSLQCSIAILMHYRDMWTNESGLRTDLLGRAFIFDFFSSTLTCALHLIRKDAPLSGAVSTGCEIPPRQSIYDLLANCIDIWVVEKDKSVCYRTGYHIMRSVQALIL